VDAKRGINYMALDYEAILDDLRTLLLSTSGAKQVFIEADAPELILDNMPLMNIRLTDVDENIVSIPDSYYEVINIDVDVVSYHLTDFKKASILRNAVLKAAKELVRGTPLFSAGLLTSRTAAKTRFGALSPEGAGGRVAVATFTVTCEAYVDT